MLVDQNLDSKKVQNLSHKKRVIALRSVAQMERQICRVTSMAPYFDDLHDFYEREVDGYLAN